MKNVCCVSKSNIFLYFSFFVSIAGENLSLQGKATQSSLYDFHLAYNAIDGNRNNRLEQGSCAHTKYNFEPWWRLDLRNIHKVFTVKLFFRDTFQERLDGVGLHIGNSLDDNGNSNPR